MYVMFALHMQTDLQRLNSASTMESGSAMHAGTPGLHSNAISSGSPRSHIQA